MSLAHAARLTGYSECTLRKAGAGLAQRWERGTRYRHEYRITKEQLQQIIDHLGQPLRFVSQPGRPQTQWSRKWERCRRCRTQGTRDRQRHYANGYCGRCYRALRRNPNARLYRVKGREGEVIG